MFFERKQLLQKILEALVPYWDMAEDFLAMLREYREEDEELVNKLYIDICENIKKIKSKDQLQKISSEIKGIKKREMEVKKEEEEYLENLLDLIDKEK